MNEIRERLKCIENWERGNYEHDNIKECRKDDEGEHLFVTCASYLSFLYLPPKIRFLSFRSAPSDRSDNLLDGSSVHESKSRCKSELVDTLIGSTKEYPGWLALTVKE